jgi:hypothetical protein
MTFYELRRSGISIQADLVRLRANGVPVRAMWDPDPLFKARVRFEGKTFEFDDADGELCFVILARDQFGAQDIIAWRSQDNYLARWHSRSVVLGEESLAAPRLETRPALPVHETVLQWLIAGRDGLVILDKRGAASLLAGRTLVVGDAAHGRALRADLTRAAPSILVKRHIPEAA